MKRPKTPKIKGCYNCARRRISCDRKEPTCQKCASKGLVCGGLGLRYRFNEGIASRGKLKGSHVPGHALSYVRAKGRISPQPSPPAAESAQHEVHDIQSVLPRHYDSSEQGSSLSHIPPIVDSFKDVQRHLMTYFSLNVAPMGAVINQGFNIYRDLLLPLAEHDGLVKKAVILVSSQHILMQKDHWRLDVGQMFEDLLKELVTRSVAVGINEDRSSVVALLLLHLHEAALGGDDLNLIYGSLHALANVVDLSRSDDSLLWYCVRTQIMRFSLYAETLRSEGRGMMFLQNNFDASLEFLRFCSNLHPEHKLLMDQIFEVITIACDIYVGRASNMNSENYSIPRLDYCRRLIEQIDLHHDIVGKYILGWAVFVFAAESCTKHHRAFWSNRLEKSYANTGNTNLLRAIKQLHAAWALQGTVRWTSLLGGANQSLIV
ncbi:hypothetical protein K461DRAFT_279086 [Myriangium duriaei CBS 260.36]|uniref:Zn(2)-C6 fungal-type domain-containing protein n=1 Tax=Myriangium duriaei CBS 260.36 TaxID=1168546 RepID=A0A9P4MEU0_9PEZI|nr:hypothetical protein K461DRAFT_279086 [Myriangium duriaei CBS 260.36]